MEKCRFAFPVSTDLVLIRVERFYLPGISLAKDEMTGRILAYVQHKLVLCTPWSEKNTFTVEEVLLEGVSTELSNMGLYLSREEKELLYEKCDIRVR